MAHTLSDEAIVLHAYDIGEADRLCILLTKHTGKIAVRVAGARKILSRKGGSLLPLQRIHVHCRVGRAGYSAETTEVLAMHATCRSDIHACTAALQGMELLLRTLEDEHPLPDVYDVSVRFLDACDRTFHPALLPLYTAALFDVLGTLPSFQYSVVSHRPMDLHGEIAFSRQRGGICLPEEAPDAFPLPRDAAELLHNARTIDFHALPSISPASLQAIVAVTQSVVGNQLGSSIRSLSVSRAISSGVTPTW